MNDFVGNKTKWNSDKDVRTILINNDFRIILLLFKDLCVIDAQVLFYREKK